MGRKGKTSPISNETIAKFLKDNPEDILRWAYDNNQREVFNRLVSGLGQRSVQYNDWVWVDPKFRAHIRKCLAISVASHIIQNSDLSDILPFSLDELLEGFLSKFKDGMSWANHGDWHIDHIVPKYNFKFNEFTDKSFVECWSLDNLQPLWAKENMKKGRH